MPLHGRIVLDGDHYRITAVHTAPDGGHTYDLGPLVQHQRSRTAVEHSALVRCMVAFARYTIGQHVLLARSAPMIITKRHWDFRNGTVWYYAAVPNRTIGAGWFNQETVSRLDRGVHPVPDNDEAPTLRGHSYPPPDWL